MNRPCWLSYLDGTMPAAERAQLEAELAANPALQADFEAYKNCCGAIKNCCQKEAIPLDRLRAQCLAKQPARPSLRRTWVLAAAAASIAVAAYVLVPRAEAPAATSDPFLFAKGPVVASLAVNSPQQAADYARQNTNFDVPVLNVGEVSRVECGVEWACMEMKMGDEKVRVYLRPGLDCDFVKEKEMRLPCGTVVYCCEGTGWQSNGYSFYAVGGSEQTRMELASLTRNALAGWKPRLN